MIDPTDYRLRLRQQTVLAKFGELALKSESLDEILTEACRLIGEGLGTELAKVMALQDDGATLLVRAGVGWKPGVVGKVTVEAASDTSEGYALATGEPMVSSDIERETRFTYASFLVDHGVRAVANVAIIGGQGRRPFGILQIDSRTPREFTEEDVSFMRSYANLLAAAVDRLRVLDEVREGGVQLRRSHDALEARVVERTRDLSYIAFHDGLTKLHNRAFFLDRLTVALTRTDRKLGFHCAVLFLDVDRFKLVNDSLGHRAGDLLLIEVARRLEICTRAQDTLGRMGGDEFALLIEGFDNLASVVAVAQRIIEAMRQPMWLGDQEVFTSCSIGLAEAPFRSQSPEELLRDADIAMYQAKQNGTGGYAIFTRSMHDAAVNALDLRIALQNAVVHHEFVLHYQPIYDTSTMRTIGFEALIRWQHPRLGLVYPASFIGVAEETGLIREIGAWILNEACKQMCLWRDQFPVLNLQLNVNTSGEELKDDNFLICVEQTLEASGLDPQALQLEFTESVFLKYPGVVGSLLTSLRALGVRFALDDFGSGYSSLGYLDQYNIDTIKIDRSFVIAMMTRPRTMVIVEAIVKLGHALGVKIVAEGVENNSQLEALRAINCNYVQGYLFNRPMSVDVVTEMLSKLQ